jgi:hypothetical protein
MAMLRQMHGTSPPDEGDRDVEDCVSVRELDASRLGPERDERRGETAAAIGR